MAVISSAAAGQALDAAGASLESAPSADTADVRITERGGVVVLTGSVPSVRAWRTVREAVLGGAGVTAVADELQVVGARPLRGAERGEPVARAIAPVVDGGAVAVQVDDGITTLWGWVRTSRIRQRVLYAARGVVGGGLIQCRIDVG